MPLPFIAGLLVGSVAVLAWSKRELLKDELSNGTKRAKDLLEAGFKHSETSHETIQDEINKHPQQDETSQTSEAKDD